jgi:DNA-binding CsgD family transcriptional regulator
VSLGAAVDVFERCGSTGWATLAREELDRVSGRRAASETELTPTERRVAELAMTGLSNKEIAAQLFVSVNTVEGHLSRTYAKLGVRSRRRLVEHLSETREP